MAVTLDSTMGGEHSNSYCDLAFADAYFEEHENQLICDGWAALSDEKKSRLLIKACRILDGFRFTLTYYPDRPRFSWVPITNTYYGDGPYKNDPFQKLQFPRNIDFDTTAVSYIPEEVMMAQCEQAYYILNADTSALETRMQGVISERVSVGTLSVAQNFAGFGHLISPMAYELVKDLMVQSTRLKRA